MTDLTARISVLVKPEEREAFFDWCRRQSPRVSMSEVLRAVLLERIGSAEPKAKRGAKVKKH